MAGRFDVVVLLAVGGLLLGVAAQRPHPGGQLRVQGFAGFDGVREYEVARGAHTLERVPANSDAEVCPDAEVQRARDAAVASIMGDDVELAWCEIQEGRVGRFLEAYSEYLAYCEAELGGAGLAAARAGAAADAAASWRWDLERCKAWAKQAGSE